VPLLTQAPCWLLLVLLLLLLQVRDNDKLVQKVHVVSGDISLPCLGLSAADRATLVHSVDFVIHCAADIRLEADIQVSPATTASAGIRSTDSCV
jgi:thioester reductase-like protein